MESVQDSIINRKNTHEVFGYDLMVDTDLNVWLIEINSSPCMEYSTDITKKLVKLVMEDTLKVIVDYNFAKDKTNVDTGLWKLIHKGNYIEINNPPPGLNLMCVGNKITSFNDEI
jgi:tubulin monoglycylase TTLL3/8